MEVDAPSLKPHVRNCRVFRQGSQPELYPVDLDSRIKPGSEAWCVKQGLATLDLKEVHQLYELCGGVPYEPRPMLSVLLLGYLLGVSGAEALEERCEFDYRFIWVSGGLRPDDRTIGRFRRRLAPVMDSLFLSFSKHCQKIGILKLGRVAIDGTKLQSAAGGIAKWLRKADEEYDACGLELPECSDPEARLQPTRRGTIVGYNAQVAVDEDSGLVVATAIADSPTDRAELVPMLERIKDLNGRMPDEVVADKGYDSAESLTALENAGVEAYVPPQDDGPLFWTAVSPTELVCPMGESPTRVRKQTEDGKRLLRLSVPVCPSCVFYMNCCSNRHGRSLSIPEGADPVLRVLAAHRARSPEGKQAMTSRLATVEPFFAQVKGNRRMGRLKLRGKAGAALELGLMALARNMKVLHRAVEKQSRPILRLFRAETPLRGAFSRGRGCQTGQQPARLAA